MIVGNSDFKMTLLKAYLSTPRAQRALASRPHEQGFSLIELVVVVAVLAILSAIAIPSFTSINDKARSSAAANTLASLAKECAVKVANGCTGAECNYAAFTLDGYNGNAAGVCASTGTLVVTSTAPGTYPTFTYNVATGAKTCATAGVQNCSAGGTW
jgi:type IV pilus assembly protein PilA